MNDYSALRRFKPWFWGVHWPLLLVAAAIGGFGLLALYSAAGGSAEPWMQTQLVRFAVGLLIAFVIASVDIDVWRRLAWLAWFGGVGLLLAVEFWGVTVNNATRWLQLGFVTLQPSELMRVAMVLVLAAWFQRFRHGEVSKKVWLFPVPALLVLVPALLVLRQPDFGTAAMILALGAAVIFMSGLHLWYFFAGAGALVAALPLIWVRLQEYQQERILTFLNPEGDPLGAGYHTIQSKIALGSGGLSGKGFLGGTQGHLSFLPEMHTDFIFTLLAEEFGLLGSVALLGLYLSLFAVMLFCAWRCRGMFGRLLVSGLCINLALYVFINVGMVSGLLPVVGVPLPLVSYGGTVVLVFFISLGLVVSVSRGRATPAD
ncbi:MAG: rod shape-determining protein RodA [Alphaproteobacteria bacterium]|nr:rod shape-determining protein RodA [Alphaproteobacteria bacterium]MDA7984608.1 rod shape-determining protein RodA [Alphaproteobacteria bacterium]MDA7988776.1 rod shape-determining protein RodA [Alphaproteobacteria bacterium]MDA8008803.1 rod shape-determining protein RodA [Alphaproteobacteria bacterium]